MIQTEHPASENPPKNADAGCSVSVPPLPPRRDGFQRSKPAASQHAETGSRIRLSILIKPLPPLTRFHLCCPFRQPPCASFQSAPCGPKRPFHLTGTASNAASRPMACELRPHGECRFEERCVFCRPCEGKVPVRAEGSLHNLSSSI